MLPQCSVSPHTKNRFMLGLKLTPVFSRLQLNHELVIDWTLNRVPLQGFNVSFPPRQRVSAEGMMTIVRMNYYCSLTFMGHRITVPDNLIDDARIVWKKKQTFSAAMAFIGSSCAVSNSAQFFFLSMSSIFQLQGGSIGSCVTEQFHFVLCLTWHCDYLQSKGQKLFSRRHG